MNSDKNNAVLVAVRQAPIRPSLLNNNFKKDQENIIEYPAECPSALIVDGKVYTFDHVFKSDISQLALYENLIQPLVVKVLAGYDCTALAYGQTGTGKSYSMGMQAENVAEEHLGVLPRCLDDMFKHVSEMKEQQENSDIAIELSASFVEIYNEKVYDLLGNHPDEPIASRGQRRFTGGICNPLRNQHDLRHLVLLGTKNRHVRPTNMNGNSSRSHAIVTIHVRRGFRHSRLNIVDLAGSEGVRRTGNEGLARTEGVFINMGLLGLNKVLLAMSAGCAVIPYRDTILTTVLQESLNPDSYLTLLACVSPHFSDLSETSSTLRFANSAKRIKLCPQISQRLQLHLRASKKKSISSTPQTLRRIQPSSVIIKRPLYVKPYGAVNNSFTTRSKPKSVTDKLHRYHSEIGLTPKAKARARDLLELSPDLINIQNISSSLNDLDILSNVSKGLNRLSSLSEFHGFANICSTPTKCKPQPTICTAVMDTATSSLDLFEVPISNAAEQEKVTQVPQQSLLSYSSFNSELESIQEENERFTSSPNFNGVKMKVHQLQDNNSSDSPLCSAELIKQSPLQHLRRSTRVQSRQINNIDQERISQRRSIRIANQVELKQKLAPAEPPTIPVRPSKTKTTANTNGLEDLLAKLSVGNGDSQADRIRKHRSMLLHFINTAHVKDLKCLPCIGPKTAIMLVTHRSIVQRFRNWRQIEELPIWKYNSWLRFANANSIISRDQA